MKPRSEHKTASDTLSQIEDLLSRAAALEWVKFGKVAGELEKLLDELRQSPELAHRLPLALVGTKPMDPGHGETIGALCMVPCRLEHIVLAPWCEDFRFQVFLGCDLQALDVSWLPGSLFTSNAHGEASDRLFVNRWHTDQIPPGVKVNVAYENRGPIAHRFEAVAWMRTWT